MNMNAISGSASPCSVLTYNTSTDLQCQLNTHTEKEGWEKTEDENSQGQFMASDKML